MFDLPFPFASLSFQGRHSTGFITLYDLYHETCLISVNSPYMDSVSSFFSIS